MNRFECIPHMLLEDDPNDMQCESCIYLNSKFKNESPYLEDDNTLCVHGQKFSVGDGVMLLPKSFHLKVRQKKGNILKNLNYMSDN